MRSLILKKTDTSGEIDSVKFSCNSNVIKIEVIVDGQNGNGSFTVDLSNDYWFTCTAERDGEHIYLVIRVDENHTTLTRYGTVSVMHNCSDITKYLSVVQEASVYTVEFEGLPESLKFKRIPDGRYEEKELTVKSEGGSGKWHVKDIQQKMVFDRATDKGNEKIRWAVPYNGCLECRTNGNKLIVRSYGDIELESRDKDTLIEYDLTIIHDDITNSMIRFITDENKGYEATVTFSFDGTDGEKY